VALVLISGESRVDYRPHTVMGLAKLLECSACLRPAKKRFHILVREAEHGGAVTLGVFISTMCRDAIKWSDGRSKARPRTYFESLR
jgi:hypothetical protein